MTHCLKTIQPFFNQIRDGEKRFELRRNDRNFQNGDTLVLQEWEAETKRYTGVEMVFRVKYLLENFDGLQPGYCIMQLV